MSGGNSAVRWLQLDTAATPDASPSSHVFVDSQNAFAPDAAQTKIPVMGQTDDGELSAPVLGPKSGGLTFQARLRGRGTIAADGDTAAIPDDLDKLLEVATGFASQNGVGDVSGASHSTTVLALTDTSLFFDGKSGATMASGVGVIGGGKYELREVETVTTDTSLTLDRAVLGAPADSAVLHAASSFYIDADAAEHAYAYFRAEGENWRRDFDGCAVLLKINAPPAGLATIDFTVQANDWTDTAEENPTYATPGGAAELVVMGSPFYIGSTKTQLISFSLDAGLTVAPRTATQGVNGQYGWLYSNTGAKVSGMIYHTDATLASMQAVGTLDLSMQLGDDASAKAFESGAYIRMPAVAVEDAKIVSHNGVDAIEWSGTCTRPASGKGSVRLHIFGKAA